MRFSKFYGKIDTKYLSDFSYKVIMLYKLEIILINIFRKTLL